MSQAEDLKTIDKKELVQIILNEFPFPIAVSYQKIIDQETWKEKVESAVRVFDYLLRTLCLVVISQYLVYDRGKDFSDSDLNEKLRSKLPTASFGIWFDILFSTLKH